MTGFLRDWLLSVTACAFAAALAQALTPKGTIKKVAGLAGGLVLLLAVVRPVLTLDPAALLSQAGLPGEGSQAGLRSEAAEKGEEVLKTLIAQKAGAYIVDKGQGLGCRVSWARVTAAEDGSGWPVPWSAEIAGSWTAEQRQALARAVEEELNIPAHRQSYQEEGS